MSDTYRNHKDTSSPRRPITPSPRPPIAPSPHHILASYLLVTLLALLPRVLDLGIFVTHDEAEFWIDRSEQFLLALQEGALSDTAISTHPGVTTMWLGTIGIFLRRTLRAWHIVQEVPFPLLLALMQLPIALVHTAGVVVGYGMLRRMMPGIIALLATLLWATDPFVIGYSRLLHVDALAGTFATLSLLAACLAWNHTRGLHWLIISGACAALAVLSKSPALALLPIVALLALATMHHTPPHRTAHTGPVAHPWHDVRGAVVSLLVWGIAFVITLAVAWPAVWADPVRVYNLLRVGVEVEGSNPHMTGNFFLGREDPSPGILFYPVALALRTTPWSLVGLLLLPLALRRRAQENGVQQDSTQEDSTASPAAARASMHVTPHVTPRDVALLAGFIVLFVLAMSIFPKKFNRYLVPVFPALDIIAAVGLVWGAKQLSSLLLRFADLRYAALTSLFRAADFYFLARPPTITPHAQRRVTVALVSIVAAVATINAWWWHPYSITFFNQALGGARAGAQTFSVGWGEGYDQVAQWLNRQPDITGVVTAAIMTKSLNPYLRHGAQATTPEGSSLPPETGYVVVSIYQAQGTVFAPFNQFYPQAPPVHTVTIHGVPYAWVYQIAPPVPHPRTAQFGDTIRLRGFAREGQMQGGHTLVYNLFWKTNTAPTSQYWLFAHLVGPDGKRYVSLDVPYPTHEWGSHRFVTTELPITLPDDAPDGTYQLTIGLYHPSNGQRLALNSQHTADPALDGPHALLLDTLELPHAR
jgi:4-amino-4-deoxy-L-arabinose transferase-like glycosyltransferase